MTHEKFIGLIVSRALNPYLSSDECTEDLRLMRVAYGEEAPALEVIEGGAVHEDYSDVLRVQAPRRKFN